MIRSKKYSHAQFARRRFCSRRCKGVAMKPATLIHDRPHTIETRQHLSVIGRGRMSPKRGIPLPADVRQKIRCALSGPRSSLWIDGRSSDPEHRRFCNRQKVGRRRANLVGSYSREEWERVKAIFNRTCPSCEVKEPQIDLSADHIVPVALGGTNNIDNIQPLCRRCNSRKGIKIIRFKPNNT
jgi:HNH endonuclease